MASSTRSFSVLLVAVFIGFGVVALGCASGKPFVEVALDKPDSGVVYVYFPYDTNFASMKNVSGNMTPDFKFGATFKNNETEKKKTVYVKNGRYDFIILPAVTYEISSGASSSDEGRFELAVEPGKRYFIRFSWISLSPDWQNVLIPRLELVNESTAFPEIQKCMLMSPED